MLLVVFFVASYSVMPCGYPKNLKPSVWILRNVPIFWA